MVEIASFDALMDKIRPAVCAVRVGDKKKKVPVTRRYILAICGAEIPALIPIDFCMHVAPRAVIKTTNFCIKFSEVSDLYRRSKSVFSH